jgi:hypothetical protein
MTFGSQRLRAVEQLESLLALANDVGPTDFLEVFPLKGRTVGTVSVVAGALGAAGNPRKPSFNATGTLLAYPEWTDSNFAGGSSIYQRSGANSWTYLDHLGGGINAGARATGFSYSGKYLAVQLEDGYVGLYTVPQYIDSWISPDTWADFNNDQWGSINTWNDPQDWNNFVDDTWSVDNDFSLFQTLSYGTGSEITFFDVAWSGDSNDTFLAIGHNSTPYFTVYQNSGTLGTTYSAITTPADLPTGSVQGLSWDPTSTYLAVGFQKNSGSTPIFIYKRSGSTLTKLSNPASIPAVAGVFACRFDPSGAYLAIGFVGADAAGNFFWVYKRSGDTFTKLADPAIQTTGRCYDLAWTADGTRLIVTADQTNTFMYRRSGDTLIYEHTFGDSVGCAVYPKSKSQR